jgi:hypothetical protein
MHCSNKNGIYMVVMFKATINNISVKRRYRNCQFYWTMVLWYPDKITDLTFITDNFIIKCCIEYTSPWVGIKLTTLMVIVTSCTVNVNLATIQSRTRLPLKIRCNEKYEDTKWVSRSYKSTNRW